MEKKKSKLLILAVVLIVVAFVTFALLMRSVNNRLKREDDPAINQSYLQPGDSFKIIEKTYDDEIGRTIYLVYDRDTRVEYFFITGTHQASIVMRCDEEGKPIVYKGDTGE